jgi:sugar porter (SP) family MFS transporter
MTTRLQGRTASQYKGSKVYVYGICLVAALGGLLFGYDTAVISGTVTSLTEKFSLAPLDVGWVAGSVLLGCMAGAVLAGPLSDRVGRKKTLLLSALLFLVSAVGSVLPQNVDQLVIARLIGGIGVGMASLLSPMYIAEIAPPRIRGRLVSINQLTIIFGMLVVYFVNARIAAAGDTQWNVQWGWRYMFGSEVIPAGLFLVMLLLVPESPRWLVQRGRLDAAEKVLARTGGSQYAQDELQDIRAGLDQEGGSWQELFRPGFRMALLIGVVLAVIQQSTGINVILYYTPKILETAGAGTLEALDSTVLVGLVMLAFTLVAFVLVDKLGRKLLMMISSAGMGLTLLVLGLAFGWGQARGLWVLLCLLGYVAFFSIAMGPVTWVIISEVFPNRIRGLAMSVCVLVLWAVNYGVTKYFPYMLEHMQGAVFYPYAGMCALAVLFIALVVPETKGRTLEDIERMWLRAK